MAKMLLPICIFIVVIPTWLVHGLVKNCGILGTLAEIQEAPWLVSVLHDNTNICSGVIYSVKFILTASECVEDLTISDLKVRAGSAHANEGGAVMAVCTRLIHAQASKKTYDSNLALLGLCEPLQPSDTIKEIKEVQKVPVDGANVTTFGWGSVNLWAKISKLCLDRSSMMLRKAVVQVYNETRCADDRRGWRMWEKKVTGHNICTKKPEKICSYSMGSPLVAENSLVGILSTSDCSKNTDVFSSLVNHKDWLKSNTKV